MTHEVETAAGMSLGGFFRRRAEHAAPIGTPCANCATPLMGPWCHACGQVGEDFHRSIFKLIMEIFEGLLHFDGRVWKTLPDLFLRPAKLTRAYLEGHRAPQIPPLRLFLVVLLAVFFAGSVGGSRGLIINTTVTNEHGKILSSKTRTYAQLTPEEKASVKNSLVHTNVKLWNRPNPALNGWLSERVAKAFEDPERFKLVLEQWSERFAFLTLPLAAGMLSLLFVFQRRFYIFDHTIFSLHSLSAVGLLLAVGSLFSSVTKDDSYIVLALAPVHLFRHMRGVYGTSIIGTLARMTLLFAGTLVGVGLIIVGLLWVGLSGMAG
jgi:hypothetical protein